MKIKFNIAEENLPSLMAFLVGEGNSLPEGKGRFAELVNIKHSTFVSLQVVEEFTTREKESTNAYAEFVDVKKRVPQELLLKLLRAAGLFAESESQKS